MRRGESLATVAVAPWQPRVSRDDAGASQPLSSLLAADTILCTLTPSKRV